MAVSSPPPQHRLTVPRFRPHFLSAPFRASAMMVPTFLNAGFRVGIFAKLALNGCSSVSANFSALADLMAIGVVAQGIQPSVLAFCARSRDVMANWSWDALVKEYFRAQSSAKVP